MSKYFTLSQKLSCHAIIEIRASEVGDILHRFQYFCNGTYKATIQLRNKIISYYENE